MRGSFLFLCFLLSFTFFLKTQYLPPINRGLQHVEKQKRCTFFWCSTFLFFCKNVYTFHSTTRNLFKEKNVCTFYTRVSFCTFEKNLYTFCSSKHFVTFKNLLCTFLLQSRNHFEEKNFVLFGLNGETFLKEKKFAQDLQAHPLQAPVYRGSVLRFSRS